MNVRLNVKPSCCFWWAHKGSYIFKSNCFSCSRTIQYLFFFLYSLFILAVYCNYYCLLVKSLSDAWYPVLVKCFYLWGNRLKKTWQIMKRKFGVNTKDLLGFFFFSILSFWVISLFTFIVTVNFPNLYFCYHLNLHMLHIFPYAWSSSFSGQS